MFSNGMHALGIAEATINKSNLEPKPKKKTRFEEPIKSNHPTKAFAKFAQNPSGTATHKTTEHKYEHVEYNTGSYFEKIFNHFEKIVAAIELFLKQKSFTTKDQNQMKKKVEGSIEKGRKIIDNIKSTIENGTHYVNIYFSLEKNDEKLTGLEKELRTEITFLKTVNTGELGAPKKFTFEKLL